MEENTESSQNKSVVIGHPNSYFDCSIERVIFVKRAVLWHRIKQLLFVFMTWNCSRNGNGTIVVVPLHHLNGIFWIISWLDVSTLFLFGSIRKLGGPTESAISVVLIFTLNNCYFIHWLILGTGNCQSEEGNEEDLSQFNKIIFNFFH